MNLSASRYNFFKITKKPILADKCMLKINNDITRLILSLFKVNNIDTRTTSIDVVLVSLLLTSNLFKTNIRIIVEVWLFVRKTTWYLFIISLLHQNLSCPYLTEAATGGVLYEKVFLITSQNSQENTCVRVSFIIKLQA